LTRSGLTYPEVSSKVCHDSFLFLHNTFYLKDGLCYTKGHRSAVFNLHEITCRT